MVALEGSLDVDRQSLEERMDGWTDGMDSVAKQRKRDLKCNTSRNNERRRRWLDVGETEVVVVRVELS
jgi:hypothetical protein